MSDKIINLGIQIIPKSKTLDAYTLVDKAIEIIQRSGVKHVVTPFETVMEGPQEKLMEIARNAQDAVLAAGADEVLVYYRMQIRNHEDVRIEDKIGKYTK
ncbi:thiamine-binding protein [Arthrospiribacter ruber]|uniref:Thiamine-binding protein n=1 Tax=Arthrospiribacter ruber TaxID=2487934 RepID=A0A951J3L5_9BACT|nr:thiamine-binding protein [Arthrospiribacter ruber]MBW3469943.1 thiamine-binding protein [Arthrospiribacter ruber]